MIERLIWVVPLLVATFGAWRPRAGLVLLAAALPLFGSPPGGPYLAALDVAGIAAILTAWRAGRPRSSALTWPVAAFVAVGLLTLVPSPYLPPSWRPSTLLGLLQALPGVEGWPALYTWRAAADLLLGWGLFLAVRRAFSGRSPMPLAWGLLAGLAGTLLVGLASYGGLLSLDAYRPDYYRGVPLALHRLSSLFFLSGWLSQYIVIVAPVAVFVLHSKERRWRRFTPLLVALLLVCLALTQQRGAWVAALAQLAFWAAVSLRPGGWDRRRLRRVAVAVGLTLALTAVVLVAADGPLEQLIQRAGSIESGLAPRLELWDAAGEMFRSRPLLGWGLGSFTPAYYLQHPPGSEDISHFRGTAHSLYFHIAAERGILGLVTLGALGLAAAVCLRRPRQGREALALALAVSLLGAAVYGLVQYIYYLRSVAWILWLLTACVTLVSRCEQPILTSRLSRGLALAVLALLPLRALLGDAPSYAGNREFGFHESEQRQYGSLQWTTGLAARRIPWTGETLVLGLANGHPRGAERPVTVVVGVDGETVASLTIPGGWEEHRFELGPPRKESIVVTLAARPAFRPFSDYLDNPDLRPSTDIRSLGVAVKDLRCE